MSSDEQPKKRNALLINSTSTKNSVKYLTNYIAAIAICLGAMTGAQAKTSEAEVITDIAAWKHPVKEVLIKNKVKITKLKLLDNKKYPVFYVKLPYDPQSSETNAYFYQLYAEILEANAWWSYALYVEQDQIQIEINWDKVKEEMTVNIVPLQELKTNNK